MTKIFFITKKFILTLFLLCAGLCFAKETKERNFFGFQFGIGGTIPIYSDQAQWDAHSKLNNDGYARIIFGSDVGFSLKLSESIFFVCDFENCFDFSWKNYFKLNCLDYAFSGGFQIYPNTKQLSFSIAYCLGTRTDIVNLPEKIASPQKTKWGNGFKIAVEYDIFQGGGIIPVIGTYYRFMPRGYNEFDNILSVYFRLAFR